MSAPNPGIAPHDPSRDDEDRLREIAELGLVSPETDAILQATVDEVAERLGLPKAMVTVVLDQAQYFAAQHGVDGWQRDAGGTPVEWSFCAHAVASREPLVIEDATTHPLTRDNPLVTQEDIRCYAGIPLISSRGHALGTLCAIGTQPREFRHDEIDVLRELAAKAVRRIEERRNTPG
ncbi:MAG TPA: GAF domain-containing protein [Longimicrobiaceae bacterium]|nr:GAF domain-containing protein [Longimicrobiaceae bacterium]